MIYVAYNSELECYFLSDGERYAYYFWTLPSEGNLVSDFAHSLAELTASINHLSPLFPCPTATSITDFEATKTAFPEFLI